MMVEDDVDGKLLTLFYLLLSVVHHRYGDNQMEFQCQVTFRKVKRGLFIMAMKVTQNKSRGKRGRYRLCPVYV